MNSGFIYVASKEKLFYELALYSAESLKDLNPSASITLFTHEAWVDYRALNLFDSIITGIPVHKRAKMWAMARTPYDNTFYLDVDSQIIRPGLQKVFKELENCDIMFTPVTWFSTVDHRFSYIDKKFTIVPQYHGAVCCYKRTELTLDFMQTWFDEYYIQDSSGTWPYGDFSDPIWKGFDMFTLWRMTCGEYEEFDRFKALKIKLGSRRYNSSIHDGRDIPSKPIVVQIDKETIKNSMPDLYNKLLKGINDERDLPKQLKTRKDTIQYN